MSIRSDIAFVLVPLGDTPQQGKDSTLVRLRHEDHKKVDQAAQTLGMTKAQFLRTLVVRGAEKVLAEAQRN